MSYTALYRKYRPNNFSNVVGQDVVVDVLRNSIKSNHISHAYLFAGPRGTGKTSIAKIFAHAVNCQNFTDDVCDSCQSCEFLKTNDSDIIEIDAASNNGVEEIRTIRDNVKLLPTFCKYKIYIIDEVHMLSTGAFNALLKTLEEPPSHVIFILATTEPNKIPLTILSRCQRFDFNKIDSNSLINRLNFILQSEDRTMESEIVKHIAEISDGGLRDAINLLDQALSLSKDNFTVDDIDKLSGKISKNVVFDIFNFLISKDYVNLLKFTNELALEGKSYSDIVNNMLILIRDYGINKEVNDYFDKDYSEKLSLYDFTSEKIVNISKVLNELLTDMKNSNNQKLLFEIYLLHLVKVINTENLDSSKNLKDTNNYSTDVNNEKSNYSLDDNNSDNINNTIDSFKQEEVVSKEIKIEKVETSKQTDEAIVMNEFKKIRINNVLFGANKDKLNSILGDYDRINDFISNKTYNSLAALLNDGKVVVASEDYLLFSFEDEALIPMFDSNYKQIEIFLNEIYDKMFKIVAISIEEWEKTKKEFIFNKKNNIPYVFIPENDVKLEMSNTIGELENSAMSIFGEDTISVK